MKITLNPHFNVRHIIGILMGLFIASMSYIYFKQTPFLVPVIAIGVIVAASQFWMDFYIRNQNEREMEKKFPEFVRNMVGAVKSGMPFTKAIVHVSTYDYGPLSPIVKKLAHKVEWSVPVHKALKSFAEDTKSRIIKRAIATVIEAEQSGGNIEDVLESITSSLIQIKKMKEKRAASIQGQVVQSYIIFFAFLGIMILIQNVLIPYAMAQQTTFELYPEAEEIQHGFSGTVEKVVITYSSLPAFISTFILWLKSFDGVFLMLALIQGMFAGLVLGKLAEGDVTAGLKHSAILMTVSFILITFAQGF